MAMLVYWRVASSHAGCAAQAWQLVGGASKPRPCAVDPCRPGPGGPGGPGGTGPPPL